MTIDANALADITSRRTTGNIVAHEEFSIEPFLPARAQVRDWTVVYDGDLLQRPILTTSFSYGLKLREHSDPAPDTRQFHSCGGLTLMHLWRNPHLIPLSWQNTEMYEEFFFDGLTLRRQKKSPRRTTDFVISLFYDPRKRRWFSSLKIFGAERYAGQMSVVLPLYRVTV